MSSLAARPLVTGLIYPETLIQPSSHLQRSQRWSTSTLRSTASSLPQVESGTLPEFTPRHVPEVDTRQQTGSRGLRVDGSPDSRFRSAFSSVVPSFERRQDGDGDDLLLQPPADPSTEFVSSLAFTTTSEPTATSSLEPSLTVSIPSTAVPSSVSTITSVPAGRPTSDTGMGQTFQLGNITVTKAMLIGLGVVGAVVLIGLVVGLLFCLSIRRRRKAILTSEDYEKKEVKYLTSEVPKAPPVVEPFMARTPLQPTMTTPFTPSRPVNPFAHYRPADMALDAPTLRRGDMRTNSFIGAPTMSIAPPTPVLTRPLSRLAPIEVATPRPVSPRGAVGLPTSPYPSSHTPSPVFQASSSTLMPTAPLAVPSPISPFGPLTAPANVYARPDSFTLPVSRPPSPAPALAPEAPLPSGPIASIMAAANTPTPLPNFSRPFAAKSDSPRGSIESGQAPLNSPTWLGRKVNAEYRWPNPRAPPPSHPRESPF